MSILSDDREYAEFVALQQDAIDRGQIELAISYGWSAIERADRIMIERFGADSISFSGITAAVRELCRIKRGWRA